MRSHGQKTGGSEHWQVAMSAAVIIITFRCVQKEQAIDTYGHHHLRGHFGAAHVHLSVTFPLSHHIAITLSCFSACSIEKN